MRGDISVVGQAYTIPRRIAASSTKIEAGEPIYADGTTLTNGVVSANTYELMDADGVVLGTDTFGGVAMKGSKTNTAGTNVAQTIIAACPVPNLGRLRGKAESAAAIDTAAELLGVIGDVVLIDYAATGGADGGELFTIKSVASADTSAFTIVEGDTFKGTLDVVIDPRGYRTANDIS